MAANPEPEPDDSDLAQAAAALSSGQSASFSAGAQDILTEPALAWQTAFYHDDIHGLIHLMGKPQSNDEAWEHQYFRIADSQWIVVGSGMWNNPGHIYGSAVLDYETGDMYCGRGINDVGDQDEPRKVAWWKYSSLAENPPTGYWGYTPEVYTRSEPIENHMNALGYHPHLYGTHDGGLAWLEQGAVYYWRKSNDAVENSSDTIQSYGYYGDVEGGSLYWPAGNCLLLGSRQNTRILRITPNETPGGTPVHTDMGTGAPLRFCGSSYSSAEDFGSMHVHPSDPNRLVMLATADGDQRCYESTDAVNWTQVDDHPFTLAPRVICSLRGNLGCFWAIGQTSEGQHFSTLWKP